MEIKRYKIVSSTSALAKKLKKPKSWQVILAEEQKAGYGRKRAEWFSPKGGLYFSVILPKSQIEDLQILTILAAFVIAKIIKEDFHLESFIKLPNDIYVNQKKIGGILTETVWSQGIKSAIMGIGLNTNIEKFPKELKNIATSLKIELGKDYYPPTTLHCPPSHPKIDNEKILKQIIEGLKEQLKTISE